MDYLLALQALREGAGSFLNPFFYAVSQYSIALGPAIVLFVYWCVDKRMGAWGLFNLAASMFATNAVKLAACVYRPWVLDQRLHAFPQAAHGATGYSFPSGHTTMTTSTWGPLAVWQRKRGWMAVLAVVAVLLMAFSRNWLGAHTLADVVAAIILSLVMMGVTFAVMRHVDEHPERDVPVAVAVLLLCAVVGICLATKTYPMEYGAEGSLLVDPRQMTPDFWGVAGMLCGWVVAWVLERRFVKFDCAGSMACKAVRFLVGIASAGLLYKGVLSPLTSGLSPDLADFIGRFAVLVFAGAIYPALFMQAQKRVF